jgi:hypothetical protein
MTLIQYGSLKIGNLSSSSGLFIGTNVLKGRKNQTLTNEGFGSIKGHNKIKVNSRILKKNS